MTRAQFGLHLFQSRVLPLQLGNFPFRFTLLDRQLFFPFVKSRRAELVATANLFHALPTIALGQDRHAVILKRHFSACPIFFSKLENL